MTIVELSDNDDYGIVNGVHMRRCPECDGARDIYEGDFAIECEKCSGTGRVPVGGSGPA